MHEDYSYPADLARFVRTRCADQPADVLDRFFSTCYQASLLREEERPVVFRAVLAEPDRFSAGGRPPETLQRMEFSGSHAFDPEQLRRLAVAADPHRTLIGVWSDAAGALRIWGLVNSGARWLRDVYGGRRAGAPLPPVPVVHVEAPGVIHAYRGDELLGRLRAGRLSGTRADPFESRWLPASFAPFMTGLLARHDAAAREALERSGERWAPLERSVPRRITERMMMRVVAVLRDARHGGTIAFLPNEWAGRLSGDDPVIDLKYRFADHRSRLAFPDLITDILDRLARLHAAPDAPGDPVSWSAFETSPDDELATLDEALFEHAHLIAGIAAVDGAVVMTQDHDLLGFGGMISGRLPPVSTVLRALDLEGEHTVEEETGNVGARHRSAYRLAGGIAGAVVVVVSQDGGVRFVTRTARGVTYWEQD
jgi:hypothetical protein